MVELPRKVAVANYWVFPDSDCDFRPARGLALRNGANRSACFLFLETCCCSRGMVPGGRGGNERYSATFDYGPRLPQDASFAMRGHRRALTRRLPLVTLSHASWKIRIEVESRHGRGKSHRTREGNAAVRMKAHRGTRGPSRDSNPART